MVNKKNIDIKIGGKDGGGYTVGVCQKSCFHYHYFGSYEFLKFVHFGTLDQENRRYELVLSVREGTYRPQVSVR